MTNKISYFSIHDILRFVVLDKTGYFNRLFDTLSTHYACLRSDGKVENCDLTFELGEFKPDLENKYVVGDGEYYLDKNYLCVAEESFKSAKWTFEVRGFDGGKTYAKINCNTLGRLFITGNVVDFLIHSAMMEKGYPVIHASSVSGNGSAFAFSSRGGGGKTTIALELVARGFDLIGDNYTIIHDGEVFSFPTALSIFTYNLSPLIVRNLKVRQKVELDIKRTIHKATMGYAKFFTKINPKRVCSNIVSSSKLSAALLLMPHTDISDEQVLIQRISLDEFAKSILYNQMLEFSLFNKCVNEYSYLFPQADFSLHWQRYETSLKRNLKHDVLYYKVVVPQTYRKDVFEKIMHLIENIEHDEYSIHST